MLETLKSFWARPYSADMTATQWALFIGFLIMLMVFWSSVITTLAIKSSEL